MQITVELKPLTGTKRTRFGNIEVEHDVLTILGHVVTDDGQQLLVELGQVGKQPGRPVSFRRDVTGQQFPEQFKEAAIAAVEKYHQRQVTRTSEQPAFGDAAKEAAGPDDDTELEDSSDFVVVD